MKGQTKTGFTLIELLVGMAIAGILISIGLPNFSQAIKENRISTQYNALVASLYLARSESIKGPGDVTVCPRKSIEANTCGGSSDWNNGWLVFVDKTQINGEATANIDSTDEIISLGDSIKGNNSVIAISSPTKKMGFIRYTASGGTSSGNASVIICDVDRGSAASRSINVVLTGDIRRGRASGDNKAPRDVFNQPISNYCPDTK